MIPIKRQPEPHNFYKKVQKPGEKFLAKNPAAKGRQLPPHWRKIIPKLREAYSEICAYTCHWIPPDTGSNTVEHFKPKEFYPELAYCWDNYRLVCGTLNGRKGKFEDVLDPFTLQEGWFIINFPSLQLKAGKHLTEIEAESVKKTISRLQLNHETCIQGGRGWLQQYLMGEYPITYLEKVAPFLASELKRQNIADIHHEMWEDFKKFTMH